MSAPLSSRLPRLRSRLAIACFTQLCASSIALVAVPAGAQTRRPATAPAARTPIVGRFDVGGGLRWTGSIQFGGVDANETALGAAERALFRTTTDLDRAIGGEARVSVMLTRVLEVEGAVALGRADLKTLVSGDLEGAPDTTLKESLTQYAFEGGVLAQLTRWRVGRLAPFATAGAGYLRQLHDGHTLVDTGQSYYVGGGVKYESRSRRARPTIKARGIRADVRATFLSGDVALDNGRHVAPSLSASYYVKF